MADVVSIAARVRQAARDARVARARSLARRLSEPLLRKYLQVVPSVYTACGEFAAFRLLVPSGEALSRLRDRAVLTLDSAAERLGGFRFGRTRIQQVYVSSTGEFDRIGREGIGQRRPGSRFPLQWAPPGWDMLFAVVPRTMPPFTEKDGFRVVTPAFLIRELIGFYGLRADLLARCERRIPGPLVEGKAG
jgi:hypothetical protein